MFQDSSMDEKREKQLDEKLANLKSLICIFSLNTDDYTKALMMCKIYKTKDSFRQAFLFAFKGGFIDYRFIPYLTQIKEIYTYYKYLYSKGIIRKANETLLAQNYLDSYPVVSKVLISFMESNRLHELPLLLQEHNITLKEYELYLKIAEKLNPNLYQKYLEKEILDKYNATVDAFKNIAYGIKTGYLLDGTPFNKLAFWLRVPFKYDKGVEHEFNMYRKMNPSILHANSFRTRIGAFTEATMKEDSKVIMNYIVKNKLYYFNSVTKSDLKKMFYGTSNIKKTDSVSGKVVEIQFTPTDVTENIQMMEENNYPFLLEIFHILREELINQKANEALEKKNCDALKLSVTFKNNK